MASSNSTTAATTAAAAVAAAAAAAATACPADIQAAFAKAVQLRALHAAVLRAKVGAAGAGGAGLSPSQQLQLRLVSAPSPAHSTGALPSSEDYPVFTPSYSESLTGHNLINSDNRSLSETWSAIRLGRERNNNESDNMAFSDAENINNISSSNSERNFCSSAEHHLKSRKMESCSKHLMMLTHDEILEPSIRRTSSTESQFITTCNTCKPAGINRESNGDAKIQKQNRSELPLSNHHPSAANAHAKHKGQILSWIFPKSKKKPKSDKSLHAIELQNTTQLLKDWGALSLESLKKDLLEANENRDVALQEVAEMKSSLAELTNKLVSLESYCNELRKALKQAIGMRNLHLPVPDQSNPPERTIEKDATMPVSHEAMVEGFLQIVSEARLSVKQFCKALLSHAEEADDGLLAKINLLVPQHELAQNNNKLSKRVLYQLEAVMSKSLFQDFENFTFQNNGSPKFLDPKLDRLENFASFVALRNLSWNQVLQKGTKYYCADFSRFCDQKMSCIVSALDWSSPWSEQLLQCFFVAAKCIWLLHLLAFSFSPPLMILRIEENRRFDPLYMEDVIFIRQKTPNVAHVKIMLTPGFYVDDMVLKCRVLTM